MDVFYWETDGLWNQPKKYNRKKISLWLLQHGICAVNISMLKILTTIVKGKLFENLKFFFFQFKIILKLSEVHKKKKEKKSRLQTAIPSKMFAIPLLLPLSFQMIPVVPHSGW